MNQSPALASIPPLIPSASRLKTSLIGSLLRNRRERLQISQFGVRNLSINPNTLFANVVGKCSLCTHSRPNRSNLSCSDSEWPRTCNNHLSHFKATPPVHLSSYHNTLQDTFTKNQTFQYLI